MKHYFQPARLPPCLFVQKLFFSHVHVNSPVCLSDFIIFFVYIEKHIHTHAHTHSINKKIIIRESKMFSNLLEREIFSYEGFKILPLYYF
jgi:hypothetical protein